MRTGVIKTDQTECYDKMGEIVPCLHSGQDGDVRAGIAWPEPRFLPHENTVFDNLTGLIWTTDANLPEFPLMWEEALAYVAHMNDKQTLGQADWRLPNRKELFSLVSHMQINPALPEDHPFQNVFSGYYWTSTTCARLPKEAWYVHLGGARLFKGMKHGSYMVWPVRGDTTGSNTIHRSGQHTCFSAAGAIVPCPDCLLQTPCFARGDKRNDPSTSVLLSSRLWRTSKPPRSQSGMVVGPGQDGALQMGVPWPKPRFVGFQETALDNLTGLEWTKSANQAGKTTDWKSAMDTVQRMNADRVFDHGDWRLPNIRELESLVDAGSHSPALPHGHPFRHVEAFYWSSTTSTYDSRYAWVLYMEDGSVGIGYKPNSSFFVWAVRTAK